jgi:hypothetical protein
MVDAEYTYMNPAIGCPVVLLFSAIVMFVLLQTVFYFDWHNISNG